MNGLKMSEAAPATGFTVSVAKIRSVRRLHAALVVTAVMLAACAEGGFQSSDSSQPSGSHTTTSLTETETIPGLGFRIGYPGGWALTANEDSLLLAETEEDLQPPMEAPVGYRVRIQSVEPEQLIAAGYEPTTGLPGLLRFNAAAFGWPESTTAEEIEVGGSPALSVRIGVPAAPAPLLAAMGELNGRYFMMGLEAANEAALESFMPVWEAMLASVRPSE